MPRLISIPKIPFNPKSPTVIHLDLNSAFASLEQQSNPFLRGKPIGIVAYDSPHSCVIAPSREAKTYGVKTGMRLSDARLLCPQIIPHLADATRIRAMHLMFQDLLKQYTHEMYPRSIDEFSLQLEGYPSFSKGIKSVGMEIKQRIKKEIGDFLTVSVGIAPNMYLAKVAAGLHKPDGLDQIDSSNFMEIYSKLQLMDLPWIKKNNSVRLSNYGIFTIKDFFNATADTLIQAFHSITGLDWYGRLHGFEVDDIVFGTHSYGNTYALMQTASTPDQLAPILMKLVEKTTLKMHKAGWYCKGVHVALMYRDGSNWHKGVKGDELLIDSRDVFKIAFKLLCHSPYKTPVSNIAESCYALEKNEHEQTSLLVDYQKKKKLSEAIDSLNEKFGGFVITPALMLGTESIVPDRIAFGGLRDLESLLLP